MRTIFAIISMTGLSICLFSCGDAGKHLSRSYTYTNFAVLAATPNSDDTPPATVVASLREAGDQFMRARRVLVGSDPGWLVLTSSGELCLVRLVYPLVLAVSGQLPPPITSKVCASEQETESGYLVETDSLIAHVNDPERNIVVGIVPDGVATVKIIEADGRTRVSPVTHNAYEALAAYPSSVEFVSRGHRHTVVVKSFGSGHYESPKGAGAFPP